MTKIICPAIECVYCLDGRCAARKIHLQHRSASAYYGEGRLMWVCREYEQSQAFGDILGILGSNVRPKNGAEVEDG